MFNSKLKIQKHFSGFKGPYASVSVNRLWRRLRNREKSCFTDMVKNLRKKDCLDMGAGSGEYSKILLQNGAKQITCVDFSSSSLSFADDPGMERVISDVEEFETDKKYDLILCLGILEFLDKPKDFLVKLKAFLKPKGRIIILLPQSGFHVIHTWERD